MTVKGYPYLMPQMGFELGYISYQKKYVTPFTITKPAILINIHMKML